MREITPDGIRATPKRFRYSFIYSGIGILSPDRMINSTPIKIIIRLAMVDFCLLIVLRKSEDFCSFFATLFCSPNFLQKMYR
jgi:hypothetical protein